jgi:arylsulfatase A-like enzyme
MSEYMKRRKFLKTAGLGAAALSLGDWGCLSKPAQKPNIVFLMADDLGYNELGSYGQTKIRTPNLDRMAGEGMRFTQHYSGSPVCAPSRCVLLTGKHTGHAYVRANDEMRERGDVWRDRSIEGQRPLPTGTVTMATLLKSAGYATGAIGKWGLGGPTDSGHPNNQGFDFFYGYLCQRVAHNYYPTHLWRNGEKHILDGNEYFYPSQKFPTDKDPDDPEAYSPYSGRQYAPDLMEQEALDFVRRNRDKPFFLYLPFIVPHASLQVPEDSLKEYEEEFPETPYLGEKGYLPHQTPHAAYAAMITRMDRSIGRLMDLVKELGLDENTLFVFTSDNGPTFNGGTDSAYFESAKPLRGLKTELYEGGIRVPMIARWAGRIKPGTVSDHVSAFWDFLPTMTDLAGAELPKDTDGVSLLPTLLSKPGNQKKHEHLYWEYLGGQVVRMGDWKGIRPKADKSLELYNLDSDIGETTDLADREPDIAAKITELMKTSRTESDLFPLIRQK